MSLRESVPGRFLASVPPVIRAILIACTLIWLLELFTTSLWSSTWRYLALVPNDVIRRGWVWELVTYQFLHDPLRIGHVLFNLFALWVFGRHLERRWGSGHFLAYYLTCGVGGGLAHLVLGTLLPGVGGGGAPVVGASAAVLGLMVAYAVIWPHQQLLMAFLVPMEARHVVWITAIIEIALAWTPGYGAANFAHLGGMLTGWLYLRHGWRLGRVGRLPAWIAGSVRDWSRRRKRARMKVLDSDLERWLRDDDDRDPGP